MMRLGACGAGDGGGAAVAEAGDAAVSPAAPTVVVASVVSGDGFSTSTAGPASEAPCGAGKTRCAGGTVESPRLRKSSERLGRCVVDD